MELYKCIYSLVFFMTLLLMSHPLEAKESDNYRFVYCSATRFHGINNDIGNRMGHSYIYIQGLRYTETEKTAHVELYNDHEIKGDLDKGIGVSVDADLIGTPYIIVNGRHNLLGTDWPSDKTFTYNDRIKISNEMGNQSLLLFPKIKESALKGLPGETPLAQKSFYSFGTDHHLSLARTSYCINIPLNRKLVERVANKMNFDFNSFFIYDPFKKNCSGSLYNILAETGLVPSLNLKSTHLYTPWNWSIPGTMLLHLDHDLFKRKFKHHHFHVDEATYRLVVEDQYLPIPLASFWEKIPFYKNNKAFEYDPTLWMFKNFSAFLIGYYPSLLFGPLPFMTIPLDKIEKKLTDPQRTPLINEQEKFIEGWQNQLTYLKSEVSKFYRSSEYKKAIINLDETESHRTLLFWKTLNKLLLEHSANHFSLLVPLNS